MAGVVPAIHAFLAEGRKEEVDAREDGGTPPRDAAGCLCAGITVER